MNNDFQRQASKLLAQHPEAKALALKSGLLQDSKISNQTQFDLAIASFKTQDPATLKVIEFSKRLAELEESVLITGESGTGKELVAKILHGRRSGEFVGVNINAISNGLFESELFGHCKGAFTGAISDRVGLVEQADSGTLFIDEIGDLSLEQQVKLLRLLQEKTYRKVGDSNISLANCRFVFATHRNLKDLIRLQLFRRDLFERIGSFKIHIPALRDRLQDCALYSLPVDLWAKLAANQGLATLSGNVRQLLNLKRQVEILGIESITTEDLL